MRGKGVSVIWLAVLLGAAVFPVWMPVAFAAEESVMTHEQQISEWRERRNDRLSSEDGWLTLVGLEWLNEGENRVGSGVPDAIPIPGGPGDWGTVVVDGTMLKFIAAEDSGVMVDGVETGEALLVPDSRGKPTVVSSGDLGFYVIDRGSYALRIKDRQSEALQNFTGVKNYDFQPGWRLDGRFIPAQEGQTIEIANVLGQVSPTPVFGYVEFERDGKTYRLLGLGGEDSEAPWFLFTDRTTGKETYGAGRYLYSEGLPSGGRLVIDFNKAYNPPCAFSDFATCPLPPQENRLDLAVTAGEKSYHSH